MIGASYLVQVYHTGWNLVFKCIDQDARHMTSNVWHIPLKKTYGYNTKSAILFSV